MGNRNDGNSKETSPEIKKMMNSKEYREWAEKGPGETPIHLAGEAKVLEEAYKAFSANGITTDEKKKLIAIDDLLEDASIQLTKDGGAVITDNSGKSVKVQKPGRSK